MGCRTAFFILLCAIVFLDPGRSYPCLDSCALLGSFYYFSVPFQFSLMDQLSEVLRNFPNWIMNIAPIQGMLWVYQILKFMTQMAPNPLLGPTQAFYLGPFSQRWTLSMASPLPRAECGLNMEMQEDVSTHMRTSQCRDGKNGLG